MSTPASPSTLPAVREPVQPVAALLAFLLPGAGHYYLGYRKRGVRIGLGVALLFVCGLLFGGIDSVDRRENPLWFWFYGQMWSGPAVFAVDWAHQRHFKVVDTFQGFQVLRSARPNEFRDPRTARPLAIQVDPETGVRFVNLPDLTGPGSTRIEGVRPPKLRTLGRVAELGTLFVAVAGMMNLIAIIDAMFKGRAEGRSE
ncbi:MAG: hypothetical protein KF768_07660 [Phycisphaeraceae bacterium]|nr:hypothetical protein [Phycisphaeraceae bacterium]